MVNKKSVGLNISTVQIIHFFFSFDLHQLIILVFETETCVVLHVAAAQRTLPSCLISMQPTSAGLDAYTTQ